MCGRVAQKTPLGEIRVLFETVNPVPNAAPTYNGADRYAARRAARSRRPALARSAPLGADPLVGQGHQDRRALHQCDGRDVASKPAFRDAFARGQRCIVPVDAFYEWKKIGAASSPTRSSAPMGCRSPSRVV